MAAEGSDMGPTGRYGCEPRSFKLAFREGAAVNISEINEEILDSVSKYGGKAVLGYTKRGRAVTFEELARNGLPEVPPSGGEAVRILHFDFKEDGLFVLDRQSAVPLARLKLTVAYRPLDQGPSEPPEGQGEPADADYIADVYVRSGT